MKVSEIAWEKVPKNSYILAYFREKVIFEKFDDLIKEQINNNKNNLLELHVFNNEKEYRIIRCQNGQYIEAEVSDQKVKNNVEKIEKKIEHVQLHSKYYHIMKIIKIINYISYDENGMIFIDNYRIAPSEGSV